MKYQGVSGQAFPLLFQLFFAFVGNSHAITRLETLAMQGTLMTFLLVWRKLVLATLGPKRLISFQ